jgi:hypothetical protein
MPFATAAKETGSLLARGVGAAGAGDGADDAGVAGASAGGLCVHQNPPFS